MSFQFSGNQGIVELGAAKFNSNKILHLKLIKVELTYWFESNTSEQSPKLAGIARGSNELWPCWKLSGAGLRRHSPTFSHTR